MKNLFATFLMSLFCLCCLAQKKMDDVVYLKNGSIIRGSIMQIIPDSMVQIKQAGGSVWVFSMKEISLIDKEDKIKTKPEIVDAKGFQVGADVGFLLGSAINTSKAPLAVHIIGSYRVIPAVAVGVGSGLEFFNNTQVPVFLDCRYYLNRKFYSPYVFIQGGAMIPIGKDVKYSDNYSYKGKTGYMFNPGLGFLFPLNEKAAVSVNFSYRYHELNYERINNQLTDYTRIEKMNRFNFSIGFLLQ